MKEKGGDLFYDKERINEWKNTCQVVKRVGNF